MSRTDRPRLFAAGVCATAVLVALAAVVTTGEAELSLLMVATVISGLACFDTSMDRLRGPSLPWAALSVAPVAKTVPSVLYELRAADGAPFARYDHAGTLLFGVCILIAVMSVSTPAPSLGRSVAAFDRVVMAGTALTAGLAGTSAAFLFERDFGSVGVARTLETSTWFVVGALTAATALAAARTRTITSSVAALLVFGSSTTVGLAVSAVGANIGRGWWALSYAALAVIAVSSRRGFGARVGRDRESYTPAVIAVVTGLVAGACAIVARSDSASWGPGWVLLGVLSVTMFVLALRSPPVDGRAELIAEAAVRRSHGREPTPAMPDPAMPDPGAASRDLAPDELSDAGIVASARAAAAVRTAPHPQRHSLAPLEQAHHFDPSTGLLSAAGLQHAIIRAFDVPRDAGHVTLLLFTIRDLARIERDHGRLVAAAVTRTVADRVRALLPDGAGARFTRTAYAVLLVGDRSKNPENIQAMARVAVRLGAPVDTGSAILEIDVVAGMAQCYDRERAAPFVQRANLGLARAVQSPEPTLVAMP